MFKKIRLFASSLLGSTKMRFPGMMSGRSPDGQRGHPEILPSSARKVIKKMSSFIGA